MWLLFGGSALDIQTFHVDPGSVGRHWGDWGDLPLHHCHVVSPLYLFTKGYITHSLEMMWHFVERQGLRSHIIVCNHVLDYVFQDNPLEFGLWVLPKMSPDKMKK